MALLPPVPAPSREVRLHFTDSLSEDAPARTRSTDMSREGNYNLDSILSAHLSPQKSVDEDAFDPAGSGRKYFSSSADANSRPGPTEQLDTIRNLILSFYDPGATELGNYMYLIDAAWVRHWLDFVLGEERAPPTKSSKGSLPPGLISNWKLIATPNIAASFDDLDVAFPLKPDLVEGIDFYLVPHLVFTTLVNWYCGGPYLPRFLNNRLRHHRVYPLHPSLMSMLRLSPAQLPAVDLQKNLYRPCELECMLRMDLYPAHTSVAPSHMDVVNYITNYLDDEDADGVSAGGVGASGGQGYRQANVNIYGEVPRVHDEFCMVCDAKSCMRCSQCSVVYYCSRACQQMHWRYHKAACRKMAELASAQPEKLLAPQFHLKSLANVYPLLRPTPPLAPLPLPLIYGRRGLCGLNNIGNSCYLSSSLQCLLHVQPLSLFILSGSYEDVIFRGSLHGTKGRLVDLYAALVRDMYLGSKASAISPDSIKDLLGEINEEYAGAQQHDAHEIIELLLDKLHEDLNRIHKKPYIAIEDMAHASEEFVRSIYIDAHEKREQSLVKQLFGSFMRYQAACAHCGRARVSYEFHHTVQLAIPRNYNIYTHVVVLVEMPTVTCRSAELATAVQELRMDEVAFHADLGLLRVGLTLDRLCGVATVREQILEKLAPLARELAHSELLLFEYTHLEALGKSRSARGGAGEDGDAKAAAAAAAAATDTGPADPENKSFKFMRAVRPGAAVHNLNTNNVLYCYAPIADYVDKVVVHMRHVHPAGSEYVGPPLMVSVDLKWPGRRLRYAVWIQLLHLLDASSADNYLADARVLLERRELKGQFAQSDTLALRLIDSAGGGVWLGGADDIADPRDRALGSLLANSEPIETYCAAGTHRLKGLLYVALDLDTHMLELFDNLPSLDKIPRPGAPGSRRQRHNSSLLTLEECLHEHCKEEQLDAANPSRCPSCDTHAPPLRTLGFSYLDLPDVLVLTLKRFEYRNVFVGSVHNGQQREKIDILIDFPLEGLDLLPFVHRAEGVHIERDKCLYDLFAVCNHYGRMGFGHYTAMCRDWSYRSHVYALSSHLQADDKNRQAKDLDDAMKSCDLGQPCAPSVAAEPGLDNVWYHLDDDRLYKIPAKDVRTPSAYILFYRRRHQRE